ncbi:MAG: ABC transporter substrate-binding protein, partial [Azospira sp.]|nr:ABC transporter substrate-binding protein [Azospira sp.]
MLPALPSRLSLFLAAVIALLAPAWAQAAPQAPLPIRIGVYGPFTGGPSPMGLSMRDGIRLATAEINAGGGLLGRPL